MTGPKRGQDGTATKGGSKNKQRPRGGGLRALAATLPAITKRAVGTRDIAEGGLIAAWPTIVGTATAARCQPKKLSAARPGSRKEGTLTVRVEPSFALELQHLIPQIIERINSHYGYAAVSRLTLQQGPLSARRRPSPPTTTPLTAADEARLRRKLATVEDEEVRSALERLGRALRRRPAPDSAPRD